MLVIPPGDIAQRLGRQLSSSEHLDAEVEASDTISALEAWCRRKFSQETIVNERHVLTGYGFRPFLNWGDPTGMVELRYGDRSVTPSLQYADSWMGSEYWRGNRNTSVYVTYTTDQTMVEELLPQIINTVARKVAGTLMTPNVVRVGVLDGYSVEGTNIQFANTSSAKNAGQPGQTVGGIPISNLSFLYPIRRTLVV